MSELISAVEPQLSSLLGRPGSAAAEQIVALVRSAMNTIAESAEPGYVVLIADETLDDDELGNPALEFAADVPVAVVLWPVLHPPACQFLHALRAWEELGSESYGEAVRESALVFLEGWRAAVRFAASLERIWESGIVEVRESVGADHSAALRELVLQGLVLDSGARRGGRIVWMRAGPNSGNWDA